ncbi:hypothetical protein XELAEV_18012154mg [Xenopus laevis]|uniref:Uncharacterized protein n=1 Tax=Xenopus laevis TaxID=8355 RepID=A0A974DPU6_XENLA|nr:hypothetical protein XELAEV_18012154mg [Xenopus laevis]
MPPGSDWSETRSLSETNAASSLVPFAAVRRKRMHRRGHGSRKGVGAHEAAALVGPQFNTVCYLTTQKVISFPTTGYLQSKDKSMVQAGTPYIATEQGLGN